MARHVEASPAKSLGGFFRKLAVGAVFLVVVVVLLMWLAGTFHRKIGGGVAAPTSRRTLGSAAVVPVRLIEVPTTESAVGTIRAVHETSVASKLLAKVVAVNVVAGQTVQRGEVLVRLDDEDLRARLQQAEAAVESARAARDQAQVEMDRIKGLFADGQAAQIEYDRTRTALKAAVAELQGAEQARNEAHTVLEYATIRAPLDGTVIDKQVEVGDTAQPGQVVVTLYDPTRMQLIARVRESLAQRLRVGQTVKVGVDALKRECHGRISEIVPEAESASRTFSVKVTGPCPKGIYSGMFGRLRIPLDNRQVLVVPAAAVRRVGQLDLVEVVEERDGTRFLARRAVRLGERFGAEVEVLSGLSQGEAVAVTTDRT